MALTHTPGRGHASCPDFDLPATTGARVRRSDLKAPFLVMFICNHCPYVKAIEDRLITLGHDLREIGVGVVAISSNDANHYPDDSFPKMKARAEEKNYSFPYLYDEDQTIAKTFGAVCTPDFFMYDHKGLLAYSGRLDDSWKEASQVKTRELYNAAKLLAEHKPLTLDETPSMGCSIKWKNK